MMVEVIRYVEILLKVPLNFRTANVNLPRLFLTIEYTPPFIAFPSYYKTNESSLKSSKGGGVNILEKVNIVKSIIM